MKVKGWLLSHLSIVCCLAMFILMLSGCAQPENTLDLAETTFAATEPPSPIIYTRQDLEVAVVELAWDYFLKGNKLQYCSQDLTIMGKYYNGDFRLSEDASPEDGTSDTSIYSVCSDYVYKVY